MNNKFEKGKNYVYKSRLRKQNKRELNINTIETEKNREMDKIMEDKEVRVFSEYIGYIGHCPVIPEWCEERSDIKEKMKKVCDLMFATYAAMQELYETMEE